MIHKGMSITSRTRTKFASSPWLREKWLNAINIPGAQRLWGLAISPDGSKLAIADVSAGRDLRSEP